MGKKKGKGKKDEAQPQAKEPEATPSTVEQPKLSPQPEKSGEEPSGTGKKKTKKRKSSRDGVPVEQGEGAAPLQVLPQAQLPPQVQPRPQAPPQAQPRPQAPPQAQPRPQAPPGFRAPPGPVSPQQGLQQPYHVPPTWGAQPPPAWGPPRPQQPQQFQQPQQQQQMRMPQAAPPSGFGPRGPIPGRGTGRGEAPEQQPQEFQGRGQGRGRGTDSTGRGMDPRGLPAPGQELSRSATPSEVSSRGTPSREGTLSPALSEHSLKQVQEVLQKPGFPFQKQDVPRKGKTDEAQPQAKEPEATPSTSAPVEQPKLSPQPEKSGEEPSRTGKKKTKKRKSSRDGVPVEQGEGAAPLQVLPQAQLPPQVQPRPQAPPQAQPRPQAPPQAQPRPQAPPGFRAPPGPVSPQQGLQQPYHVPPTWGAQPPPAWSPPRPQQPQQFQQPQQQQQMRMPQAAPPSGFGPRGPIPGRGTGRGEAPEQQLQEFQGRGQGRGRGTDSTGRGMDPRGLPAPGQELSRSATPSEVSSRGTPSREGTLNPALSEHSLKQVQEVLQKPGFPFQKQDVPPEGAPVKSATQPKGKKGKGKRETQVPAAAAPVPVAQPVPVQKPQEKPAEHFALDIPRRKELRQGGTKGRQIVVETNHLPLKIDPRYETAIHYDVVITPDKPKRLMRRVWEQFRGIYLPNCRVAFDDVKNAYAPQLLQPIMHEGGGEVQVAEDEYSLLKTYKVQLRYAATVNLRSLADYMATGCTTPIPQDALQCLDIVLRNVASTRFVKVGRSFFTPPRGSIVPLGDGLEMWYGHFQSAVIGWKPFLNVDVAHKGFPTAQAVVRLMEDIAQARIEEIEFRYCADKISKFLKGLKVIYELPGQPATRRTFRVNGLVDVPGRAMFTLPNGEQTSVLKYFQQDKHYNMRFPNVPVLHVGPRDRKIYLPSELCTIVAGQVVNRKLNELQTSKMVRNAATPSGVRKEKIMASVRMTDFNSDPTVRSFGLHVGNEFERVRARVLEPPNLLYSGNTTQRPARGVWRANAFLRPESLDSWTVLNLDRRTRDDKIDEFVRYLTTAAKQQGMQIGQVTRPYPKMDDRQLQNELPKYKSMKLIFVIVPDYPTNVYSKVKRTAELSVGCLTQCIRSRTLVRINPATVGNIILKVNAKLNGLNHTIADVSRPPCLRAPCIIMGADVTHPSPDQTDIPSVAAVTASCDATAAFQYNFCWRLQPARQEIIMDLEAIAVEQLMFFYKKTKQKPQRIIFFRDGVSEGQFQQVMNAEVQALRNACNKMGDGGTYKPPITFLVVQKRHHTRFFPTDSRNSDDKNYNVQAGTVVDTEITHPTAIEYYLVSHASIQGVARPTKYRVLWDDSRMTEDELEALSYYLCHMFSRCTRSVSYPAPTYYAHLAAFRARVYLEEQRINLENLSWEQKQRTIKEEIFRGKPMFFV